MKVLPRQAPRVLMYHYFGDTRVGRDPERLFVSRSGLLEQLQQLRRWGWTPLDLDGYLAALNGGPVPRRSFLVTIDDGHASVVDIAAPVLMEAGVPSVLFVCPGRMGGPACWSRYYPTEPLADAGQIAALPTMGMELGLHGLDHTRLVGVGDAVLHEHVVEARAALEAATGSRVRAFAYPYGSHDERARQAVEGAGYAVAFAVAKEAGRLAVDRIFVRGDERAIVFRWKLSAGYLLLSRVAGRMPRLRRAVRSAVRWLAGTDLAYRSLEVR